jgi:acetyl-CoA carboxylase biotin carboxyl carrier protein
VVEIDKLRELVAMMVEHELTEIELRDGEETIVLKRGGGAGVTPLVSVAPATHAGPATPPPGVPTAAEAAPPAPAHEPDDGLVAIPSPMVGTFYAAPDPESPPFVGVGASVDPDTVVCVIEAMKVFNEIKANVAGTIEKVLVRNETAVEYGQPLFLVRAR